MSEERIFSREQIRFLDQQAVELFGIPSIVLMENAGRSCAETLLSLGVSTTSPVCICCGKGNNGGDGFVMARHLSAAMVPVEVLLFCDETELSPDAAINYVILLQSDIPVHRLSLPDDTGQFRRHLRHASWVVDALLGTGFHGDLRSPLDSLIIEINDSRRPVLAIDVPSGLDCDLGTVSQVAILATATLTLVGPKPGFATKTGRRHCGQVLTGGIGIPHNLISYVCSHPQVEDSE